MHFEVFDAAQADELNRNSVPFQFCGCLDEDIFSEGLDGDSGPVPLLRLDTTMRPDVADLARVLGSDGPARACQPLLLYYGAGCPGIMLGIAISDPVTCTFNLFLAWPRDQEVLHVLVAHGAIYLITGADREWHLFGLRVGQANQQDLAAALRVWACRDRG